tara:strand:- start:1006 stop:1191 length:186 start_codon:yes stop_codon:yes gene_type:complete
MSLSVLYQSRRSPVFKSLNFRDDYHPASITFCEKIGLDYVSPSPFRVPIARLAAAQAALEK